VSFKPGLEEEGAEVTRSGRLLQTRAAATGKARSPTVRSRVRLYRRLVYTHTSIFSNTPLLES